MGRQITRARYKREITNPAAASGAWAAQRGGWRPTRARVQVPGTPQLHTLEAPTGEAKQRGGIRKQVSHNEQPTEGRRGKLMRQRGGAVVPIAATWSPGR
jgi:hypothetical protein